MPIVEVGKSPFSKGMPTPQTIPQGTSLPQSNVPNPPMPVAGNMAFQPPIPSFDEPGKYEVSESSDFTIELFLKFYKGRWILMEHSDSKTENHKVVFRMWTYNEMVELKKMATTFDLRKKVHELDNDLLNQLKIRRLLKSWTFGDKNERLKINHVGGRLTDESWSAFTKLQPNIAQYIIDEMNAVYEYNH